MSNFGNYAIIDEVTYTFLRQPSWWWKFKPITARDELALQKYLYQNRVIEINKVKREYPPTKMEIMLRELALSFAGSNIPKNIDEPVEDGGKPFIGKGLTIEAIEAELGKMPPGMIEELYEALYQATIEWGKEPPKVTEDQEEPLS